MLRDDIKKVKKSLKNIENLLKTIAKNKKIGYNGEKNCKNDINRGEVDFMKNIDHSIKTPYNVLDLAKYVIYKCRESNCDISNLKLQKIMYYIQVYYLQNYSIVAFNSKISAWMYGPVVDDVYIHYRKYKSEDLKDIVDTNVEISYDNKDKEILDAIITEYMGKSAWDLVMDTHKVGSPWSHVYNDGEGRYKEISKDDIIEYS